MYFDFFGLRSLFLVPIAFVPPCDLIVLFLANAALAFILGLVLFARILLAISIGFIWFP